MCEPLGRQSAIEDNTQPAIAVKNRLLYQAGWSVKRDIASNSDVSGFQLCSEKAIALSCYIEVTSGGQHSREPGHQDTVLRRERTSLRIQLQFSPRPAGREPFPLLGSRPSV